MKGNVYMYAIMILVFAIIIVLLIQFIKGFVPGENSGRDGNIIKVSQFNFGFVPDRIELQRGERVILVVKSAGGLQHFDIDQYNVHEEIPAAGEKQITITAEKMGEFYYYDSTPGHNESGENGLLVVK